ncbi:transglutaminase domain-containing protein, partial [Mycobacterium tuberculosis]|nr:transglutaminase domain-containing protein [Mycobacterium tuberculosis]
PCPAARIAAADAVLAAGRGDDVGLAHLFVATARVLDLPARLVTGYVFDPNAHQPLPAASAWAEAWCEGIGWIGFDAPRRTC